LQLCVLLWAAEGQDAALTEYEDTVLALIPRHGGRVVSRVRRAVKGEGPLEVQIIHLPDEAALEAYMQDPVRVALAPVHRTVVARTDVFPIKSLR
jgi:uncharacterized protein (DUF1330 family)